MLKRTFAASMAAVLAAVSFAGCAIKSPENIATYGDEAVPAGIYIFAANSQYTSYQNYMGGGDILKVELTEDKTVEDVVTENAMTAIKRYAAVEAECERLGIELSEEEVAGIKASALENYSDSKEMYEKKGIGLSSVEAFGMNNALSFKLFDKLYGEGGEKEVSKEEKEKYVENTYRMATIMDFPYKDAEGKPLEGENLENIKKEAKDYFDVISEGKRDFFDVYKEVYTQRGNTYTEGETSMDNAGVFKVTDSRLPQDLILKLFDPNAGKDGKAEFYEGADRSVIYEMHDIFASEFMTNADKNIVHEMKEADFNNYLVSKSEELELTFDNKALKTYSIKKISER